MSPDQIAAFTSLIALAKMITSWPVISVLFLMIIGPWVMSLTIAEGYRKRFEQVVRMYESNVRLVEKYENLAVDLKDVVMMNTEAMTHLVDIIKANKN
jgi:hypothetical protein